MPWFPDFVNAAELARRQTRADDRADPPAAYVTALERRTARDLESTWPGEVVIHDPRGTIRGHREVKHFVRRNGEWLAGLHARTETVAATISGGRAVLELLAHLAPDGREVAWPVAVVAETVGDRSVEFRTYCSQRPVTGTHHLRPVLDHCATTDDGARCAVEYNCVRWGDRDLPPEAGLMVCERDDEGRLAAVRLYDDIETPARDA